MLQIAFSPADAANPLTWRRGADGSHPHYACAEFTDPVPICRLLWKPWHNSLLHTTGVHLRILLLPSVVPVYHVILQAMETSFDK